MILSLYLYAQFSSVNDIIIQDFNNDNINDLLINGNMYHAEIETTRNDSGNGLLLKGNNDGSFKDISTYESGFFVPGDSKKIVSLKLKESNYSLLLIMMIEFKFLNKLMLNTSNTMPLFYCFFVFTINAQNHSHSHKHDGLHHWEIPSKDPDRIILTFNGDPSTKRAVTWRTDSTVEKAKAQIAVAGVNSKFTQEATEYIATTEEFDLGLYKSNNSLIVNYHSVIFEDLKPNTLYAYRVGYDENWSEWIQFKTANNSYSPTQFVYFGDAQNDILSHWSRVIRMAYQTAPNAAFVIHAGDLVDTAHRDYEWAQWFKAGGFIHSQWTAIPVVGNHEFQRVNDSTSEDYRFNGDLSLVYQLSKVWIVNFTKQFIQSSIKIYLLLFLIQLVFSKSKRNILKKS